MVTFSIGALRAMPALLIKMSIWNGFEGKWVVKCSRTREMRVAGPEGEERSTGMGKTWMLCCSESFCAREEARGVELGEV